MVEKRTYTFAKKYIEQHTNENFKGIEIDGILFNDLINSTTLIDTDVRFCRFEKYGMHKRNIAKYNRFQYVYIYPWDNYNKLINHISQSRSKIYARNCRIFKLRPEIGKKFIDQYDIYGNCRGQVLFLGLVYNDELLQVMSFKRTTSRSHQDVQIARLCTKSGYQVIGGVSKLFYFATKRLDLYNIVVYNDLSKFSGDVFEKIGMKLDHINPPQLIWFKDDKYIANNMLWMYRKTKEDMINESYLPIYNCGYSVYTY